MSTLPQLSAPRRPPARGGKSEHLVMLLHGYGASGDDLIGLAPYLAPLLPDAEFVSPNAPERCAITPMGHQWFAMPDYEPERMRHDGHYRQSTRAEMLAGALGAAPVLDNFIDQELRRSGLGEERLALLGFSQGTMMALHVGLRRPRPCAGIAGFSGSLVGAERLKREVTARPPILLVHGDADELVPVEALFEAVAALGAAELSVEWHVSPGAGHGIAPDGLELAGRFLAQALSGARGAIEGARGVATPR